MLKSNFLKIVCVSFTIILTTIIAGCQQEKAEKSVLALDTVITLTAEGENSKKVLNDSADFLKNLDKLASFDEGSELNLLNKAEVDEFIKVSPDIYDMLVLGKYYTDFTKKYYDISAGALVNLWDKNRKSETLPNKEDILFAKSTVNADNFLLIDGKVKKSNANTKITFGSIAKGYAADKIYSLYKAKNISGFMNFGTSTILACGDKTYRVGIKNPRDEEKMLGVVTLKNEVLSTSGDYERYFIKNNVSYHHIIDLFTGYPTNNGVASVTVIVPLSYEHAGVMSDALSTALMVAGVKGEDFLPAGVKALFVTTDGELVFVNGFELEK